MPRAEVANWASRSGKLGEGRKAALQPQPVNLRDFFRWKLIALVLTISILCLGDHFQWKKFSQSAVEVQFPGYRPFVLPTLFTRGSGNLTTLYFTPPGDFHPSIQSIDPHIAYAATSFSHGVIPMTSWGSPNAISSWYELVLKSTTGILLTGWIYS